jgi:hypothetical protein
MSRLEKYSFSEGGKERERERNTVWGDAIASKERHFSPLATISENRRVTLFQ